MAFPQGIYFRAVDDQVDPTNYDAEIGTTANYPRTTAQGNTVGWESAPGGTRDRITTGDVRLRGIHFGAQAGSQQYRIDLPAAGNYNIRTAFGDPSSSHDARIRFVDSTTVLVDYASAIVAIAQFRDATGVIRTSEVDWVANNAAYAATFASTIFRLNPTGGSTLMDPNWSVAALYIESAGASGAVLTSDAQSAATALATLSTQIPLASSAAAATSASSTLTTAISLASSANASTAASASLSTQVALSSASVATTAPTAALTTAIPLASSSAAGTSASAGLTVGSVWTASATASTGASAGLTTAIPLAASAQAPTSASAALSLAVDLAASAISKASASAALATGIALNATAAALTRAAGDLTTAIPLAASATSHTDASATLSSAFSNLVAGEAYTYYGLPRARGCIMAINDKGFYRDNYSRRRLYTHARR